MKRTSITRITAGSVLVTALVFLSGCNESNMTSQAAGSTAGSQAAATMNAGSVVNVALGSNLSSEDVRVGDGWSGTVTQDVSGRNGAHIAAGSNVNGVVRSVTPARRGSRATLELGLRSIVVDGHEELIVASSEPVIAGSTRARNLGAIGGSVAAGALIGKVVGDGKNAAVGGLIGGVAATGVVASSKGYQVVLPSGTVMAFTVSHDVRVR